MTDELLEEEIAPPVPDRVAGRAIVLSAVACRGSIEKDANDPGAEDLRKKVLAWIDRLGVGPELEAEELRLLETPLGRLEEKKVIDASWRSEGMVVLAWVLGRAELPPYDVQCVPSDVANLLGFLEEREATPLDRPEVRPQDEIEHWADTYLTLHWRLRQFSLEARTIDFAGYVESCEWGPLITDELGMVDGDLSLGGARVDLAAESDFRSALSIARERHQAFNWLLGYDPVYSEVSTDT